MKSDDRSDPSDAPTPAPADPPTRLTFASGGWVVALSLVLCGVVLTWAMLGVIFGERPLGDGESPATYGFDLSTLRLGDAALVASGQPRDFLDALDDPLTIPGEDVLEVNRRERGKFLVSADPVIGVTIAGESRAYPLRVMNAHEVCNDTLGGVPIAVTYSPLTDSVVVFDRRLDTVPSDDDSGTAGAPHRVVRFGVSGLLLDSNTLFHDRDEFAERDISSETDEAGAVGVPDDQGGSLWSQLAMRAVSGPDASAGRRLRPIAGVQLTTWSDWFERHPETTVVLRDPRAARRYKEFDYRRYYNAGRPLFPVQPPVDEAQLRNDGVEVMTPTIVLIDERGVTARPASPPATWNDVDPETVTLFMRWFAWRAFEDELRSVWNVR